MERHLRFLVLVCVVCGLLLPLPAAQVQPAAQAAQAEPLCFPEAAPAITECISGRLRTFWEQQGGLPVFGYPISPAVQQQTANGPITIQLFERNRLEHHPHEAAPYDVQLGRLGADALAERSYAPPPPAAPQSGCRFFEQTGRNLCPPFLTTWQSLGLELGAPGISEAESLALFGLPLSPPQQMVLDDGQQYTVQWFERARFEDHGAAGVRFGLLGRELAHTFTLPSNPTAPPAPASPVSQQPPPPPPAVTGTPVLQEGISQEPGGFIRASGSQLVRFGQAVRIKGVNYYPRGRPWDEMWQTWDARQMDYELGLARERLGINAVRILVPYDVRGDGHVDEELLRMMREFLQIAGNHDLRVIVTLFDFYNGFPPPGSDSEEKNFRYVQRLVGNFVGDERIFAWDLHNEPDHYQMWESGNADQVLMWLSRMADEVHRLAPNHLVTVGMGQYQNLLIPGPDGRRVIDYSDVISVHNYNAPDMARQLDEVRAQTDKPILLEEFGWPSGPACTVREYSEAYQAQVYREMLAAAEGHVAGIFAWTLRDYDPGPTRRWDTREEHYGLFRPDDSLKPAAEPFMAYAAAPLPSITQTNLELTEESRHLEGSRSPKLVEESGHYLKDWFRQAWDHLGNKGSFGLPLSEAYVRPEDGMVVQVYESAILELHSQAVFNDGFGELPLPVQIMEVVRPMPIGRIYTQGRTFPPQEPVTPGPTVRLFPETGYVVQGEFLTFYDTFIGPWRLGNPISPEITEEVNGVSMRVQYFERGRLDFNPAYNLVQFGHLGRALWDQQCRALGQ